LRGMARLGWGISRGSIIVPRLRGPSLAISNGHSRRAAARDLPRQIARFIAVGVASTLAYVLLYLALRGVLPAQVANALALGATAVANTAVNRRVTFGISGRAHAARQQFKGLIAFGIGLALTSGALAALHSGAARPGRWTEVSVLVAANLVATVIRFLLYRHWVFGESRHTYDNSLTQGVPVERDYLYSAVRDRQRIDAGPEPDTASAARA
jgi:putative flippase GtrA